MEKGYVQVYTGNGKGKTTAAFGVALRAVGAGHKTYIGQFMKNGDYSEIKAIKQLGGDKITLEQYGDGGELSRMEEALYKEAAQKGFEKAKAALLSGEYALVILDELNVALHLKFLSTNDVTALIDGKPTQTELIITGRNAAEEVLDRADLITEMREIRHYYQKGVQARIGIEK